MTFYRVVRNLSYWPARFGRTAGLIIGFGIAFCGAAAAQVTLIGTATQVTTDPSHQLLPYVSGDIVIFSDYRTGEADTHFIDISTGVETLVASGPSDQGLGEVDGNHIVYLDENLEKLFIYDISAMSIVGTVGVPASTLPGTSDISGDLVVFQFRGETLNEPFIEIGVYDFKTSTQTTLTATSEYHKSWPRIAGNFVVFERRPQNGGIAEIILYDLTVPPTGDPETNLGQGRNPHTDGKTVVWQSISSPYLPPTDIFIYDIDTTNTQQLLLAGDQSRPHVDGEFISYDDLDGGDSDVVVRHLPSGASARVGNGAIEKNNRINGQRVVYTSSHTGNWDIWRYDFALPVADIAVAPLIVDFGDIQLGNSEIMIVTISNLGNIPLDVTDLYLADGLGPFTIDGATVGGSGVMLPFTILPTQTADVTLRFSPGGVDSFLDTLIIESGDLDQPEIEIALSGMGALTEPPPSEIIANCLELIADSEQAGLLEGNGPGNSGSGRLKALINMIKASGDLVEDGLDGNACSQLDDAQKRTDGMSPPPDFVAGTALPDVFVCLEDAQDALGCE